MFQVRDKRDECEESHDIKEGQKNRRLSKLGIRAGKRDLAKVAEQDLREKKRAERNDERMNYPYSPSPKIPIHRQDNRDDPRKHESQHHSLCQSYTFLCSVVDMKTKCPVGAEVRGNLKCESKSQDHAIAQCERDGEKVR